MCEKPDYRTIYRQRAEAWRKRAADPSQTVEQAMVSLSIATDYDRLVDLIDDMGILIRPATRP